jgi:hypothetical protein
MNGQLTWLGSLLVKSLVLLAGKNTIEIQHKNPSSVSTLNPKHKTVSLSQARSAFNHDGAWVFSEPSSFGFRMAMGLLGGDVGAAACGHHCHHCF